LTAFFIKNFGRQTNQEIFSGKSGYRNLLIKSGKNFPAKTFGLEGEIFDKKSQTQSDFARTLFLRYNKFEF
jgi:hypothetical protein